MEVNSTVKRKVFREIEGMRHDIVEFLRELIQTPSITGNEKEAQKIVTNKFKDMNAKLDVFEADLEKIRRHPEYTPIETSEEKGYKDRPNVVAQFKGVGGGRSLILFGHIDTVPIGPPDAWKYDPLEGTMEHGRIYGRGAADDKGGIAQMIMAINAILNADIKLQGDLSIMSTIEEEAGGSGGTLACILKGYNAEAAVYSHPAESGLTTISIGCCGVLCFRVKVKGKMTHGKDAHLGVNAIGKTLKIYEALMELDAYRGLTIRHPLIEKRFLNASLPPRSTNIVPSIIRGGEWISQVPAECELKCRIGFPPGETMEDIKKQIEDHVGKAAQADIWLRENPPNIEWIGPNLRSAQIRPDQPIARTAQSCIKATTGIEPDFTVMAAGSDMRFPIVYANIPTIAFGAKGGSMHGADEWLEYKDFLSAIKSLALIILAHCGYE